MVGIVDNGLYWLKPHDGDEWTIGQAMVHSDSDITFYLVAYDYGRDISEFAVGERIVRSAA